MIYTTAKFKEKQLKQIISNKYSIQLSETKQSSFRNRFRSEPAALRKLLSFTVKTL